MCADIMLQRTLAVVGVDYPNKRGPSRRFELQLCRPGEVVDLRPEPNNPADPYAVAVYSARGVQIGYLRAERAPWIGKLIRDSRQPVAIFQQMIRHGAAIRVAFDGDTPTLPDLPDDPPSDSDNDPDFWPDPEWPAK